MRPKFGKVIKHFNKWDNHQKLFFIQLLATDIIVPVKEKEGVTIYELDIEVPVILNGTGFQINIEKWREWDKEKLKTNE